MIKKKIKSVFDYFQKKKNTKEILRRLKDNQLLKDATDQEKSDWSERIRLVKICPDTQKISTIENAGKMEGDFLVMHNGIKILPLSYYGYPMLNLLTENKGIHEPQEEFAFQEILKAIKPASTMIELGAYWSFYSMWFNKFIPEAKNYMIEPWEIHHGIRNFKLNNFKGKFYQYYIDENPGVHIDGSKIISIDKFVESESISFVDILHSDIQGKEFNMLKGAAKLIDSRKVGYIFISTHSNEIHDNCANFLLQKGYLKVCSANIDETYSHDGLLIFKNPDYPGPDKIEISLRKK